MFLFSKPIIPFLAIVRPTEQRYGIHIGTVVKIYKIKQPKDHTSGEYSHISGFQEPEIKVYTISGARYSGYRSHPLES